MTRDEEVAWTATQFALMADGGIWGVPRSGLLFTRRGDKLVLTSRMPHMPEMPITEAQLFEQQWSDYTGIRDRAEEAGIVVEDATIAPDATILPQLAGSWRYSTPDGTFSCTLFDTGEMREGKHVLSYVFRDGGEVIFRGGDYRPGMGTTPDSKEAMTGLLGFLSLRPGDTDDEYFEKYTPEQLAWAESDRAEELQLIVAELEES